MRNEFLVRIAEEIAIWNTMFPVSGRGPKQLTVLSDVYTQHLEEEIQPSMLEAVLGETTKSARSFPAIKDVLDAKERVSKNWKPNRNRKLLETDQKTGAISEAEKELRKERVRINALVACGKLSQEEGGKLQDEILKKLKNLSVR